MKKSKKKMKVLSKKNLKKTLMYNLIKHKIRVNKTIDILDIIIELK